MDEDGFLMSPGWLYATDVTIHTVKYGDGVKRVMGVFEQVVAHCQQVNLMDEAGFLMSPRWLYATDLTIHTVTYGDTFLSRFGVIQVKSRDRPLAGIT